MYIKVLIPTIEQLLQNDLLCLFFIWHSYNIKFTLMQLLTNRICKQVCSIRLAIVMAIDYND